MVEVIEVNGQRYTRDLSGNLIPMQLNNQTQEIPAQKNILGNFLSKPQPKPGFQQPAPEDYMVQQQITQHPMPNLPPQPSAQTPYTQPKQYQPLVETPASNPCSPFFKGQMYSVTYNKGKGPVTVVIQLLDYNDGFMTCRDSTNEVLFINKDKIFDVTEFNSKDVKSTKRKLFDL